MANRPAISILIGTAMLIAVSMAAVPRALARTPVPTGNLNLRLDGYEVVTPNGGSAARVSIDGIGQVISDSAGTFNGAETYTAVDPAGSSAEDICAGTVSGTITPPTGGFGSGDGEFNVSLTYDPSASSTGTYCIPATATLLCNRSLLHEALASDLDAGAYHCVVTGVSADAGATATINSASMNGHLDSARGSNAPTD